MSQEVIEITEREIEVIEIVESGPVGPVGPQANINYTVVSSSQSVTNRQMIAADTSGGVFALTLPADPSNGDAIDIFDYSETFDINNLTINRNGSRIESIEEDLICNVEGAYFTLIYTGATRGWQVVPRFGTSGGGGESVLTTQGDTLYRAVGVNARLPIGSAGQILKVNSGATAPEWGEAPATGVTSVSATAPIVSSGGATPTISISPATTSAAGSMSSADKTKLNNAVETSRTISAGTGLTGGGDLSANRTLSVSFGSSAGTVCEGNDARLSDARTPTPHASSHASAGSDPVTLDASQIGSGVFDNARINFAAPPAIGSTTRNTGAFTTLSANNGTLTASAPVLDLEQTWNNAAVVFTGMRLNCVQTAHSLSSSYFSIARTGTTIFSIVASNANIPSIEMGAGGFTTRIRGRTSAGVGVNFDGTVGIGGSLQFGSGITTGAGDLHLTRDAADTLALQRSTIPQAFRIYNTSANSNADFERGFIGWSSNTLRIGTEAGGTGSARNLELQTGGTTRATIDTSGVLTMTGGVTLPAAGSLVFSGNGGLRAMAQGSFRFLGTDGSSFNFLYLGNNNASYPALKRVGTALQIRLGDDSADAPFSSGAITTSGHFSPSATNSFDIGTSSVRFRWGYFFTGIALGATSTGISSGSDGVIQLRNNNGADFGRLQFGGTTSSFPALKRSTTTIQVRLADDSGDAGLSCSTLTLSDNLTFGSGDNIVLSTTTGTQIGTATTQLLGFYGATPVDRPATVADPTGGGTVDAEARTAINDIIDRLQELGLIA